MESVGRLRLYIVIRVLAKRITGYGKPGDWFPRLPKDTAEDFVTCLSELERLITVVEEEKWDIGPVLPWNIDPVQSVKYPVDLDNDSVVEKLFERYLILAQRLKRIEDEMAKQGICAPSLHNPHRMLGKSAYFSFVVDTEKVI
jgi:hypothetical protein